MNTKNMFWAVLSMTAALVMTACSSDDNDITEAPVAPPISKIIPYTVTVGGDNTTTRATVDSNNKTLRFATGDKLYITGDGIQGVLELKNYLQEDNVTTTTDPTARATFSGDLFYSGEGEPDPGLSLTATLVSAQQTVGTQVSVDNAGAVTVNYPTEAYCSSINDAVQKYSNLTGTSTYGTPSFSLSQQTAFLNFEITFNDYTTTGKTLSAVVSNGGSAVCTADVTTVTENADTENEKVVAKFVLPVAATTLSSATVRMGTKDALSINDATLTGKVYNVKRTQNIPEGAINGLFTIGKTDGNVPIKVFFSKGNLQATTTNNGTTWSWAFATNQWDYVGDNPANTKINGDGMVSENGTVDLFGWVGASSKWTGGAKYGICITTTTGGTATYGKYSNEKPNDWGENIGDGTTWRTLTCAEWDYLFQTRTGGTVGSTSNGRNARYTMATISTSNDGEVNGVILFPDGLNIEDKDLGDYFNTDTFSDSNINTATDYLTKCTSAQWTELEKKGCVFLPAAGWRNPAIYDNEGSKNGRYQSSSSNPGDASKNYAYGFTHSGSQSKKPYLGQYNNPKRYSGYSVRLVRAVE